MIRRVLLATAVIVLASLPAAVAEAAPGDAVTMVSESGDWVGGGESYVFHPGNAQISARADAALRVSVSGGTFGDDDFWFEFAPPDGEQLQRGVYAGAQRAPFREGKHPGISVSGSGRGCNTIDGSFEVRELERGEGGAVTRAWVLYEQHCEGGVPALFGEVRLGMGDELDPAVTPSVARWPQLDAGRRGKALPVTYLAPGDGAPVQRVELQGPDAGDFVIRDDECSGSGRLNCEVWVRLVAGSPGTKSAWLRIWDTGGTVHDVLLQAHARGGTTEFVMRSDPGDYIGGGATRTYTPANAQISADGTRTGIGLRVDGDDGAWWYGDFVPEANDILAPGPYTGALRYPFNNGAPGLSISGSGRGCNELSGGFTIRSIAFVDGRLSSVDLDYEQHCEHLAPALRGTFKWRAGDATPPPPWAVPGPAPSVDPPPPPLGEPAVADPPPPPLGEPAEADDENEPPAGGGNGTVVLLKDVDLLPRALGPATQVAPALTGSPVAVNRAFCLDRRAARRVANGSGAGERLLGTSRADIIFAGAGADRVRAMRGRDCADGGAGPDRLDGGAGADRLYGGAGDDVLVGGPGRDVLDCGPGRDVAHAGRGDTVRGCERVRRRAA